MIRGQMDRQPMLTTFSRKAQYPQIAHYIENLIMLTATQHNTKAHPNNNTQMIDKDYQLVLFVGESRYN